ncbi:MAG: hypothetical protein WBM32_06125 [Crocosphaera sp.]
MAQSLETMDVIPTLSSYCVWMITDRRERLNAVLDFEFKVAQDGKRLMYFVPDEKWDDIVRMSQGKLYRATPYTALEDTVLVVMRSVGHCASISEVEIWNVSKTQRFLFFDSPTSEIITVNPQEPDPRIQSTVDTLVFDFSQLINSACRNSINKTQQILKDYDLEIAIYLEKISGIYQNAPNGKIITFGLDGQSRNIILASEIIMSTLSKDIIQNCNDDRVYLVVFAQNHSGYSEAFGLINGEIKYFEIVTPPCTPLRWGTNCNT